jgi:uncharacterized protein YbgA (DUF1722 family)
MKKMNMNIVMNAEEEKELNEYYDKNRSGAINRYEFIKGITPYLLEFPSYKSKNSYLTSKTSRSIEVITKIVQEDMVLFK